LGKKNLKWKKSLGLARHGPKTCDCARPVSCDVKKKQPTRKGEYKKGEGSSEKCQKKLKRERAPVPGAKRENGGFSQEDPLGEKAERRRIVYGCSVL